MRFDHLIHWVPDRADAMAAYRAMGLHVAEGGAHPAWGTHNAICRFGRTYLELLAVTDRRLAERGPDHIFRGHAEVLSRGGGALTFALAVSNLDATSDALRKRGIAVGEPVHGLRRRPDGSTLSWRMAPIQDGPTWRPFLIEWGNKDDDRTADLERRRAVATHDAGELQVGHIVIHSTDPEGDAAWATGLVGHSASAGGTGWARTTRVGKRLFVPLPGCGLEFERGTSAGINRIVLTALPSRGNEGSSPRPTPVDVCGLTIVAGELLVLDRPQRGVQAFGYRTGLGDMFIVRAGATLVKDAKPSLLERVRVIRRQLLEEGGIEDAGEVWRLTRDHLCGSSSVAAALVLAVSANGKHNWHAAWREGPPKTAEHPASTIL